jgi:hypothetical protein
MKLLPSKNAHKMAVQYLQHEFRKILPVAFTTEKGNIIDRDLERLSTQQGRVSFWNLVAGISEDWKLKSVFRTLSDPRFFWKKRRIPVKDVFLTGMSPLMDEYIIKRCDRDPRVFGEMWKKDKRMRDKIRKSGFSAHSERDHFPVFVVCVDGKYRVFDGMRRTLLAVIGNKEYITAWVGYPKRKEGTPAISEGFCYVFSQIYRNGKEVLGKRIADWAMDENIKSIFKKMTK